MIRSRRPQMTRRGWIAALLCLITLGHVSSQATAETNQSGSKPEPVWMDTDIGDDIDDALALALLLRSPEVRIVGVSSAWGDTALRSRMLNRFLQQAGHPEIPIATGIVRHHAGEGGFSQRRWAEGGKEPPPSDAVNALLSAIKAQPGQLTLLAVGPLTNIGAALERDPAAMRQLKRIVIMGGSIRRGYGDLGYTPDHGRSVEYNIAMDPDAARKVFTAGIPLFVVPLDSSQHKLDEVKRNLLFAHGSALTDMLTLLYHQWSAATNNATPTMFDAVAAGYLIDPRLCPMTPLHVDVLADGTTAEGPGTPNLNVCLRSSQDDFFALFLPRLLEQRE